MLVLFVAEGALRSITFVDSLMMSMLTRGRHSVRLIWVLVLGS